MKKRILKDIAYEYIPRELLDRPKVGFSVPLDQWMRGPLKEQLLDVSESSFLCNQGIFDSKYVNQFVQKYLTSGDGKSGSGTRYSRIVWAFLMFQQWYKAICKNLKRGRNEENWHFLSVPFKKVVRNVLW